MVIEDEGERLVRYWGPPALADDDRHCRLRHGSQAGSGARRGVPRNLRLVRPPATPVRRPDRDLPVRRPRFVVDRHDRRGAAGGRSRTRPMRRCPASGFTPGSRLTGSTSPPTPSSWPARRGYASSIRHPPSLPLLPSVIPVLRAQGEPYISASIDAQYAVMAAAHRERVKVLLDGQGADELLGGYDLYLGVRTAGLLMSAHPLDAARELQAQVRRGPLSAGSAMWTALHAALPRDAVETVRAAIRRPVRHSLHGAARG